MSDLDKYSKVLLELVYLRENDYDGFMNRLYEALTGEFRDVINDTTPKDEKSKAIWTMIKHFEKNEEFEKCADLKKMADQLESNLNTKSR